MVKPALLPRYSVSLAGLALLCAGQPAFAQSKAAATDTKVDSEEAIFIPIEYRPPPYRIAVGVRVSGNAKVKFSGLGSITNSSQPLTNITTIAGRTYDAWGVNASANYVGPDYSIDKQGNKVDATDHGTNNWGFTSSDQVVADTRPESTTGQAVQFQTNWITSRGETRSVENGNSLAWDIEISRELGGNKRWAWGLLFGAGMSDFRAKTSGTVKGTLNTLTDTYAVIGTKMSSYTDENGKVNYLTFSGPDQEPVALGEWVVKKKEDGTPDLDKDGKEQKVWNPQKDANGNPVYEWRDYSYRISELPFKREFSDGTEVLVEGTWKVKGAFITARLGPFVSVNLGKYFTARASAGLTFTVLGTRLTFKETYYIPALSNYLSIDTDQPINETRVTGNVGYFATGEIEWHMTQRTGLFVGATYEDYLRKSEIRIGEQVAQIETSSGTALRAGVSARF